MLREFSAEIPCRSHPLGLALYRAKKSLYPIGNADEVKKSSFAGDGLKKKSLPTPGSPIKISFTNKFKHYARKSLSNYKAQS